MFHVGPTPWYDNYRDDFIHLIKQSDHEYIRHYMGCILCDVACVIVMYVVPVKLVLNLLNQLFLLYPVLMKTQ